jgi:hypothetical protein
VRACRSVRQRPVASGRAEQEAAASQAGSQAGRQIAEAEPEEARQRGLLVCWAEADARRCKAGKLPCYNVLRFDSAPITHSRELESCLLHGDNATMSDNLLIGASRIRVITTDPESVAARGVPHAPRPHARGTRGGRGQPPLGT